MKPEELILSLKKERDTWRGHGESEYDRGVGRGLELAVEYIEAYYAALGGGNIGFEFLPADVAFLKEHFHLSDYLFNLYINMPFTECVKALTARREGYILDNIWVDINALITYAKRKGTLGNVSKKSRSRKPRAKGGGQ